VTTVYKSVILYFLHLIIYFLLLLLLPYVLDPLVSLPSELIWDRLSYRESVGLLGWGINPVSRSLTTRDNTNTEETEISVHRVGLEPTIPVNIYNFTANSTIFYYLFIVNKFIYYKQINNKVLLRWRWNYICSFYIRNRMQSLKIRFQCLSRRRHFMPYTARLLWTEFPTINPQSSEMSSISE
jgi:hypothetical protein